MPTLFHKEFLGMGLRGLDMIVLLCGLVILFIIDVMQERGSVRERVSMKPIYIRWTLYIVAFIIILLLGMYGPGYDQNQFVYMQF